MATMKFDWLKKSPAVTSLLVIGALVIGGYFTQNMWMPHASRVADYVQNKKQDEDEGEKETTVSGTPDTLRLSPEAWGNIGLVTGTVKASDFEKVVSVPAIVVERPGRSQIEIAAPMTGVVTQVYPLEREAVEPGDPLFDLRLTHEDVVSAQSDFLTRLQTRDVARKELSRLQEIGSEIVAGKRLIEQEYKLDAATAALEALRQSLLLHGLTEEQIANMEKTRKVLRDVVVVAPAFNENNSHAEADHQYHVQSINVNRGQNVMAGDLLGTLADHCILYVEGLAFDDDTRRLVAACKYGNLVEVVPVAKQDEPREALKLKIQSVSDAIDPNSRALKFYAILPNELLRDGTFEGTENNFVAWKYRPGQRMEARIPTSSQLKNKIVLPKSAVVIEGPNAFVFEQNGDNFDRINVRVLHRDKNQVVLENDGRLIGSVVAMRGAYAMHLALKNQSGGAVDPHAGHSH